MKIQQDEQTNDGKRSSKIWSIIRDITSRQNQEEAFYVCNLSDIIQKTQTWLKLMHGIVPYYAVKCNDDITLLRMLAALGVHFDCASRAEITKVMSIGCPPDRIIFANPAKPKSHIRFAASVGVSTMTFDNEIELQKIQELFPYANLVLRIRIDAKDAQCPLGMKFGCDPIKEAPRLLYQAKLMKLDVVGISFHVGSGCREPAVFDRAITAARDLFDYGEALGHCMTLLDIGGGFPGGQDTSIAEIADVVHAALDKYFSDSGVRVIAEPGRFFACSAYTLACNIHSMRRVTDDQDNETHRMYFINDGVYGSFNSIIYDHQHIHGIPLKSHHESDIRLSSSVWGPTCDGLDQVLDDVMLPEMEIGDWMVFEDMGAYTLPVASPFNGFPVPEVYYAINQRDWLTYSFLKLPKGTMKIMDNALKINRRTSECNEEVLATEQKKFAVVSSADIMVG